MMSKKTKVVYMLTRFPSVTETFILSELYWLRNHDIDVYIYSLMDPQADIVHQQAEELMPHVSYSPSLFSSKMISAQFYFIFRSTSRYFRALLNTIKHTYREPLILLKMLQLFPKSVYFARQMQISGIDHIHAHFVWLNGISAMIASTLLGITFSLHPHAFGLFSRNQTNVKRQLDSATRIVTVSEYHRKYIAALSTRHKIEDIDIVNYGIDTEAFQPDEALPPRDKTPTILSIGRFIEKKGHQFLIEACGILAKKNIQFQCTILGGGPLEEAYLELIDQLNIKDKVILLGEKSKLEIRELYQNSDIFSLPCTVAKSGDQDGVPNVLMEAMAMQVPVISTPISGIPDLIQSEENGLLTPDRDAAALAKALEQLINDEALRIELGKKGRMKVMEDFNIRSTSEKLASVFKSL
jgi:colanic acid/amylovoran biosynthesis glycosyltransferase